MHHGFLRFVYKLYLIESHVQFFLCLQRTQSKLSHCTLTAYRKLVVSDIKSQAVCYQPVVAHYLMPTKMHLAHLSCNYIRINYQFTLYSG